MSKLKIVKFGDEHGVGAVVESTSFFRTVRTWTVVPSTNGRNFDQWVCRETGSWEYRGCCNICRFYSAQFSTRADV